MTRAQFSASYEGIGKLLQSDMIKKALEERAERVMERAKSIAPVSEDDRHPGRYRDAFHVRVGLNARRSRAEAVVYNDAPEALHVEKGTVNNPAYNVLIRALDVLRGG